MVREKNTEIGENLLVGSTLIIDWKVKIGNNINVRGNIHQGKRPD
ncbi:MAG: hypothetical protein AB3K77_15200 [Methanosarcinaceae archaeon]